MLSSFSNPATSPKRTVLRGGIAAVVSMLLILISASFAHAGYGRFSYETIDYYDATSGYYYRSVTPKGKSSGFLISKASPRNISNIFLFNPATNKGHLLFPEQNDKRRITLFAHEDGFHAIKNPNFLPKEKKSTNNKILVFHNYGDVKLYNNFKQAEKRPLRDHILIGVSLTKTEQTELWHCKKDGSELKKLITVPKKSHWQIDLKAMKIRVFVPDTKLGYKVSSFDW